MRKIETFCKKVVKKYLRLHLWKKFIRFFKNLTPKNDCIFFNEIKVPHVSQNTISSN